MPSRLTFVVLGLCWGLLASSAMAASPDATIVRDLVRVTVAEDNSYTVEEEDVIHLLTPAGVERFGKLDRLYNADSSHLAVVAAGLMGANGQVVPLPAAAVHDEVPAAVREDPNYGRLHHLTIDWTGATPGSTLVFHLQDAHRAPVCGVLAQTSFMEDTAPIEDSVFEVSFPAGLPFNYHATGHLADVAPAVETSAGRRTWRWHVHDVAALAQEPGMPPVNDVASKVMVSSAAAWETIATGYGERWKLADAAEGEVAPWVADLRGRPADEQLTALVARISERTPELPFELSVMDWSPLPPHQLLTAHTLSAADRTALLVVLWQALGHPATAGLATRADTGSVNRAFPSPEMLVHPVAVIGPHVVDLAVDSVGPDVPGPDILGQPVLVLGPPPLRWLQAPMPAASQNREIVRLEASLEANGTLHELVQLAQYGAQNGVWRDILQHADKDVQREELTALAQQIIPSASLDSYYVPPLVAWGNPLREEFRLQVEGHARRGSLLQPHLPMLPERWLSQYLPGPSPLPRRYPLAVGFPLVEEKWLHLVAPEGQQFDTAVPDVWQESTVGSYQLIAHARGRHLWVLSRLILRQSTVPAASYPEFVALVQAAERAEDVHVTLKRQTGVP